MRVCYQVWRQEGAKWAEFNHLRFSLLHGPKKEAALSADADIYLINPEGLPWLIERFSKLKADTLVVDESTKFKDPKTRNFKLLKMVLGKFTRRWILTGTPSPNGYMDLFGQIFIIDGGRALGKYITHYRQQFFHPTGFGGYTWAINNGAEETIQERIKPITLRLDAKDYLELPQFIIEPIWVELPPAAREVYDDMEDRMVAEIGSGKSTAVNAGSASKKCEQIANGGLYHDDLVDIDDDFAATRGKRTWTDLHTAKIDAVQELRESVQGQQLLIAYDFQHDLARLRKALGEKTPFIGGGVSPAKSMELEQLWNSKQLPVLLAHPRSMGHGLNMQYGGNRIIWHSPTWDLELWDQFNRRILRSGSQHKHIFAWPILARDTVDEAKWWALNRKDKSQRGLLDALRVYVKTRRR